MLKSGKKKKGKKKKNAVKLFGDTSIKEAYRKFLKCYDRLSAQAEKRALPSIRRAVQESKENESLLVKFVLRQPEADVSYDGFLQLSLVPLIDTIRNQRYVYVRFIYVWNIPMLHSDLVALAGLLERKIYPVKHIELVECLLEPYTIHRLCLAINSCEAMTALILDYNEFGNDGCHSVCAGLRGNRTLLTLSLCFCNLGPASGEYLSILVGTTAVREIYLDGNDLQCEGTIQLLRFCVEKAVAEAEKRELEDQLKADEESLQIAELELKKKLCFEMVDEQLLASKENAAEEAKSENKKKKKKKKEKPLPLPPPVGPWIYKLHLADNGIDSLSRPERSTLFTCLESIAQLIMYSKCLQELDLEDNFIGELGGERILEALQFRKQVGLPDVKLRTTHRIGAATLATICQLGAGLQKKKKHHKKAKKS